MGKQDKLVPLIIDTIIVLSGFAIVIYAALDYFVTKDWADFLVFLLGFIVSSYGMGRRMKNYWE